MILLQRNDVDQCVVAILSEEYRLTMAGFGNGDGQ